MYDYKELPFGLRTPQGFVGLPDTIVSEKIPDY